MMASLRYLLILTLKSNPRDLWPLRHLRHWLQFWQLKNWIHYNFCYLTIKSETGFQWFAVSCFREFDQLFKILLDAGMSKISRITGCERPCSYKEYNFVNPNLKELSYYNFPKDQIAFCLWAVSQSTYVEEEVLVYSFESLIAELGGSLGLFLGFSFMTIWDGFKDFVTWMMNLKIPNRKTLVPVELVL